MQQQKTILYECLASGQPGPYKDSFYTYRVQFPHRQFEDSVRRFAQYLHPFNDVDEAMRAFWMPYLKDIEKLNEEGSIWKFTVCQPFTD